MSTLAIILMLFIAVAPPQDHCTVDLTKAGQMSDVLSNALLSLEKHDELQVHAFLDDAHKNYSSGDELLKATATKFSIEEKTLTELVTDFKLCNCNHAMVPGVAGSPPTNAKGAAITPGGGPVQSVNQPVSKFAEDVTLHVVLHEMAHAVIREFDLPVLANEETMADAFATFYLTNYMPDRAADVLEARVKSWMIEASEVARAEWTVRGEHNNDARRAYQVAAIAVAADAQKYKKVADAAGMSDSDIRSASDYGTEVHRSWRRILRPLMMPPGMKSREAGVSFDQDSDITKQLSQRPFAQEIDAALRSFDWHSTVRIAFVQGDGGAGWNRSRRTVTVNSAYIERFIKQGMVVGGDNR